MSQLKVSPAVLRWARESFGLDLAEAADHAHFRPADLASWEHGTSSPSLPELRKLATAYRRQLATLLLPEPPIEAEPQLPDFRRRADFRPPRLSPGLHLAIRISRLRQVVAHNLLEGLDGTKFPTGAVSLRTDAADIAEEWRTRLGVSLARQAAWKDAYEAWRSFRELVERLGTLVMQMPFGDDGVRGFSFSDLPPATIVLNSSDAVSGRIFSLFHEVAHLLLGDPGLCEPPAALRYPESSLEVERYCNAFAGAFLVPLDELHKSVDAKAIASLDRPPNESDFAPLRQTFKVSSQVLWYRLHDAGYISDEAYRLLWAIWASREPPPKSTGGPAMDRPERSLNMNGRYFVNLVVEAEERGLIDRADTLDYVRVKDAELPKLLSLVAAAQ